MSALIEKPKPSLCLEGLLLLFVVLLSIAVSLAISACNACEEDDASTDQLPYSFLLDNDEKEIRRLFNISKSKPIDQANWYTVAWTDGDWSTIPAAQESADEIVWFNATSTKTGESKTARYRVRFTIGTNSPEPSAGFGFGREVWAKILNYQLVDVIKRPKVDPGVYPLLPGECVIRPIPPSGGTEKQLLETYQIEIPIGVHFVPSIKVRSFLGFKMVDYTVEHGGRQLYRESVNPTTSYFIARRGGLYTIKVFRTTQKTDRKEGVGIRVKWGRSRAGRCIPDNDASPKTVLQDAGIEKRTSNKKSVSNDKQSNK